MDVNKRIFVGGSICIALLALVIGGFRMTAGINFDASEAVPDVSGLHGSGVDTPVEQTTDEFYGRASFEAGNAMEPDAFASTVARGNAGASVLPAEIPFLRPGGLSVTGVGAVIHDDKFSEVMGSLEGQMLADADAMRIRDVYRAGFEKELGAVDAVRLDELVCGLSVCMGRVSGVGADSGDRYRSWVSSLNDASALRTYAFMDTEVIMPGGRTEYRIVFSTDPTAEALVTDFPSR